MRGIGTLPLSSSSMCSHKIKKTSSLLFWQLFTVSSHHCCAKWDCIRVSEAWTGTLWTHLKHFYYRAVGASGAGDTNKHTHSCTRGKIHRKHTCKYVWTHPTCTSALKRDDQTLLHGPMEQKQGLFPPPPPPLLLHVFTASVTAAP